MAITLWRHKSAPLTIEELDKNFEELDSRLTDLEKQTIHHEILHKISLEGDELCFENAFGLSLGRVRLPMPRFSYRGMWGKDSDYAYADLVRYQGGVYFCQRTHSSEGDFQDEYWGVLIEPFNTASSSAPVLNESF